MPTACLMEFSKKERHFAFLREIDFASIPTTGDKIVIDIEGIGYIFKVYDVHYTEHFKADVNVIRLSTITEYNSSGFPDIA